MTIKCIALDLDRTTLNAKGKLSGVNKDALEYAIAKGIHIIIASGRALTSLPEDLLSIKGIEYAVTSNGAAVYDLRKKKCLRQFKMTSSSIEQILKVTQNHQVVYEIFIDGEAYADIDYLKDPIKFGATNKSKEYIQMTRKPLENTMDFIQRNISKLDSLDIVVRSDEDKDLIWKELEESIPDIYITTSTPQLIEISHKNAGKHSGVKFVIEQLGITREEVAAFGDGDNDADMLHFVGVGIAMENASEKCREAADFVTYHHDEDGVAYGIRNILKI